MSVQAITPDYTGTVRDKLENFHGNQLVYCGWDEHLMFPAAFTWPLPPQMSFADFRDKVMAEAFSVHPEWCQINWDNTSWRLNGEPFTPDEQRSLVEQGIGHKSMLQFCTHGLNGFKGMGV